jgi:aconitate hydratase 2/2-methylisocitrate dehydratase
VEKKGKKNIYNSRILEIQGLPDLTVEQAFELSDASAERSAGGCTIELSEESVAEYLCSNITMLRWTPWRRRSTSTSTSTRWMSM